jgi:hypothetical protein
MIDSMVSGACAREFNPITGVDFSTATRLKANLAVNSRLTGGWPDRLV